MNNKVHIFIDESGNSSLNLDKKGTFSHFIYTAVVISENNIYEARKLQEKISKLFFQGQHIKGSNIGNDEKGLEKRINIANELSTLTHFVKIMVVDKRSLEGDGFNYRKSFYKFFQRIFANSIISNFDSYEICIDKFGHPEFQNELISYMDRNGIASDLFDSNRNFRILDDKIEEPLIQFADFYSNSIFSYYCDSHYNPNSEKIQEILASRLQVDFFPYSHKSYMGAKYFSDSNFNKEIYDISISNAEQYIEANPKEEIKYEILKYLLKIAQINPNKLSSTKELLQLLRNYNHEISQWSLRKEIGELRDKGVLIISPLGKYGYKLPCNEKEIREFFDRLSSSIIPMIQRLSFFNDKLSILSTGNYNILSNVEYSTLLSLVNTLNKSRIVS